MTDLFMPTYLRMGTPINRARPPTSIRPPTSSGQASRTDLVVTAYTGTPTPTNPLEMTLPTYVAGDLVMLCVSCADTSSADISTPSGWTLKALSPDSNSGAVFSRVMDGTEGTTVDVTTAVLVQSAVGIAFVHRGIDFSTFTPDSASFTTESNSTSQNPPQVTMTHGERLYDVYTFGGGAHGSGATEVTDSADYTELVMQTTGGGDTSAFLGHKRVTAETEDPDVFTVSTGSGGAWTFVTFAIAAESDASVSGPGHTHVEADITNLDHWTEADHDALDHTGLTGVGGGGASVPDWIGDLATPNSAHGDDQEFTGTIAGTAVTPAGTVTWTQSEGLLSAKFDSQLSGDHAARLYALTPTAAPVTLTSRMRFLSRRANNPMLGLTFADGTTASSNAVSVGVYQASGGTPTIARWAGTLTSMSTTNIFTDLPLGFLDQWFYLRLVWTASNTWAWALSIDGVSWTDFGASTFAATLTPTHFGPFVSSWAIAYPLTAAFEYVRVTESDLSV